jgi:hypothetical protein
MSWLSYLIGRFSDGHLWPVLGGHRGHMYGLALGVPESNDKKSVMSHHMFPSGNQSITSKDRTNLQAVFSGPY